MWPRASLSRDGPHGNRRPWREGIASSRVVGHVEGMEVELLVVPGCPYEASAYDLTVAALAELEALVSVSVTVIASDEHAQARGFTGSPTFLINGRDPFADAGAAVGLACRMYPTPSGLAAGLPGLAELHEELRRSGRS